MSLLDQAPAPSVAGTPTAHHDRRWWVLAVLGVAQLMVVLDATIVNIALPHAQAALRFSDDDRQWVITAYSLAFGSLLLLGGRLADTIGRKRLFLIGVIGFAAASAVGGAATSFAMLATARAVQGAFGAVLAPAALSLLTTTFTRPDERGKAFGIYGGIAGAGASLGLLLGGVLTECLDWRWTMYVNVGFAVAAAVGGWLLLAGHTPGEDREPLDRAGTLLGCAGMFGLVYALSHAATGAGASGWTDPVTLGFLTAGIALLAGFVAVERRAAHPLLPLRVVLDRNRGGAYAAMFLASIGMFGIFLFLTYYLETILGYSPIRAGLAFIPMTVAVIVVAAIANTVLLRRVSPRLMVPGGLLLGAGGLVWLTGIGLASGYATAILPPLLLVAIGLGLVFAPCFSLGTLGIPAHDSGVASATINVAQQIGGSIGTALLNTIAASAASAYAAAHAATAPPRLLPALAAVHSYHVAFWVAAAVFLGAAAVVAAVLRPGVPDLGANQAYAEPGVAAARSS